MDVTSSSVGIAKYYNDIYCRLWRKGREGVASFCAKTLVSNLLFTCHDMTKYIKISKHDYRSS